MLKDKKYIKIVKGTINEVLSLHLKETKVANNENKCNTNNNNNDRAQNKEFIINDQLPLETILMMIRGETIKYSSFKKKKQTEEEKQLEIEIENIEAKITNNLNEITEEDINILEEKKNALSELRKIKTEGVMLRSRCRYEELGEKPSGYFLNLENRNCMDKVITKLVDINGEEYSNSADILNLQKQYNHDLYKDEIRIDDVMFYFRKVYRGNIRTVYDILFETKQHKSFLFKGRSALDYKKYDIKKANENHKPTTPLE